MPGHDLPGLDERLRQLPAALAEASPPGAAAGCAAPAPPRPSRPCSPGPS
jgi:hypothetical protein